jgi:hypothetical protein
MAAIRDISESCWREVTPSTDWVSNVKGTISFQVSRVNDSKSSYAKHQRSPQVPSEKVVSRGIIILNIEKINCRSFWPRLIIHQLTALSDVLAPTLDASQTVGGITKLC